MTWINWQSALSPFLLHTCGASDIFTLSLVVERWNNRVSPNSISIQVQPSEVLQILQVKMSSSSDGTLISLRWFSYLTRAYGQSLSLNSISLCGVQAGIRKHTCTAYVAKSKTGSKKKLVMQSDQEVLVCGYMDDGCMDNSFCMTLSLLYFKYGLYIYLFFSFFFVSHAVEHVFFFSCFWACLSLSLPFFLFFRIAHIFCKYAWRESQHMWSIYLLDGWMACFCATSSVEVSIWRWGVRDLDHESMKSS